MTTVAANETNPVDELWQEAENNFFELTGVSLRKQPNTSLETVVARLDSKYGAGKVEKHAKTKKIVNNIIGFVKLFGNVAAQGASIVFSPAQQCFGAITFLLDMHSKISEVFDKVSELLDILNGYLPRFDAYRGRNDLPEGLILSFHRVLTAFINACAFAHKLSAPGITKVKVKTAALAAFCNNDSGFGGLLDEFRHFIDNQTALESTLTLTTALDTKKNTQDIISAVSEVRKHTGGIEKLVSAEETRSMKGLANEQRALLLRSLDLAEGVVEEQEKIAEMMQMSALDNTGAKLFDNVMYQRWADPTDDPKSVLLLAGEPHSGRSYLAHSVLESIRSGSLLNKNNTDQRILVAYHFFQKHGDRATPSDQRYKAKAVHPLTTAIKHICFQLARQHKSYEREVTTFLSNTKNINEKAINQLWYDLGINRPKSDTIHFLILDGLDQIAAKHHESFFDTITSNPAPRGRFWSYSAATSSHNNKVRTLVTGTSASFVSVSRRHIPVLYAADLGSDTIASFIRRLLQDGALSSQSNQHEQELAKHVEDELPALSKGDFAVAKQALETVKRGMGGYMDLQEAQAALANACELSPTASMQQTIKLLSKSLDEQEVKRLNQLLMWLVWGCEYYSWDFTLEQIKAVSFLNTGKIPLQSWKTIIKTNYDSIIAIDKNDHVYAKEEVLNVLKDEKIALRENISSAQRAAGPKISMEIKINNASIDQVRRFLWDLNERANLGDKAFLFEHSNTSSSDKSIQIHKLDACVQICIKLLDLLSDDPSTITDCLFADAAYALNNYLRALYEFATKDSALESEELRSIVSGIIGFLESTNIFEQHDMSLIRLRNAWLIKQSYEGDHIIYRWLTFKKAVDLLNRRDRRSLDRLRGESDYGFWFYKPFAIAIAKQWLQAHKFPAVHAFRWIKRFLAMRADFDFSEHITIRRTRVGYSEETLKVPREGTDGVVDPSHVKIALEWVEDNLPSQDREMNLTWFRRLGDTYLDLDLYQEAVEVFRHGISRYPRSHHLWIGCASANWRMYKEGAALEAMIKAVDLLQTELETDEQQIWEPSEPQSTKPGSPQSQSTQQESTRKEYIQQTEVLIDWLMDRERYNQVLQYCKAVLKLEPLNPRISSQMFRALRLSKDFPKLEQYLTESGVDGERSRMTNLLDSELRKMVETDDFDDCAGLLISARESHTVETLLDNLGQIRRDADANDIAFCSSCLLLESYVRAFLVPEQAIKDVDSVVETAEKALSIWRVIEEEGKERENADFWSRTTLDQIMTVAYFRRIQANIEQISITNQDIAKLEKVLESTRSDDRSFPEALGYLAGCYIALERKDLARKLLLPTVKEHLDMLEDDIEENDAEAYRGLAVALGHFQDKYNALVAWSLLVPFDVAYDQRRAHGNFDDEQSTDSDEEDEKEVKEQEVSEAEIDGKLSNEEEAHEDSTEDQDEEKLKAEKLSSESGDSVNGSDSVKSLSTDEKSAKIKYNALGPTGDTDGIKSQRGEHSEHIDGDANSVSQDSDNSSKDGSHEKSEDDEDDDDRPVYIRMARTHASPISLDKFKLKWEYDPTDRQYVIIKQYLSPAITKLIFKDTAQLLRNQSRKKTFCAGGCRTSWTYANNFHVCVYCRFSILCPNCYNEIQSGRSTRIHVCGPDHWWIHVPPWSLDRYEELGDGNVRIDGTITDDGITGGRVVHHSEWVKSIRRDWGLSEVVVE